MTQQNCKFFNIFKCSKKINNILINISQFEISKTDWQFILNQFLLNNF